MITSVDMVDMNDNIVLSNIVGGEKFKLHTLSSGLLVSRVWAVSLKSSVTVVLAIRSVCVHMKWSAILPCGWSMLLQESTKRLTIRRLPIITCFHLKVKFPMEIDMTPYLANRSGVIEFVIHTSEI